MKVKAIRCEVYSRVVGYYTPIAYWNIGKKEEYKDRQPFSREELGVAAGIDASAPERPSIELIVLPGILHRPEDKSVI